jgi:hypothetical protein
VLVGLSWVETRWDVTAEFTLLRTAGAIERSSRWVIVTGTSANWFSVSEILFSLGKRGFWLGVVRLLIAGRLQRPAKFGSVGGRYPVRVNPDKIDICREFEISSVEVGKILLSTVWARRISVGVITGSRKLIMRGCVGFLIFESAYTSVRSEIVAFGRCAIVGTLEGISGCSASNCARRSSVQGSWTGCDSGRCEMIGLLMGRTAGVDAR